MGVFIKSLVWSFAIGVWDLLGVWNLEVCAVF
jgi:hypothetical protein